MYLFIHRQLLYGMGCARVNLLLLEHLKSNYIIDTFLLTNYCSVVVIGRRLPFKNNESGLLAQNKNILRTVPQNK